MSLHLYNLRAFGISSMIQRIYFPSLTRSFTHQELYQCAISLQCGCVEVVNWQIYRRQCHWANYVWM